jgi:hypothetical protein
MHRFPVEGPLDGARKLCPASSYRPHSSLVGAESVEGMIGLASIIYRRITGDITPLMRGFDCWTEG